MFYKSLFDTTKKRYKLFAIFSILTHIFGALFVLYYLIYDFEQWSDYMIYFRYLLKLNEHKQHNIYTVINIWMIAIQIRYVITDSIAFYQSFRSNKLLLYTIKMHGIESIICSFVFLLHNSKDCFVCGVVCIFWSILWTISYYLIKEKIKLN